MALFVECKRFFAVFVRVARIQMKVVPGKTECLTIPVSICIEDVGVGGIDLMRSHRDRPRYEYNFHIKRFK